MSTKLRNRSMTVAMALSLAAGSALLGSEQADGSTTKALPSAAAYHLVLDWGRRCLEEWERDGHVHHWECNGGTHQVWRLVPKPSGHHQIVNQRTNRCLDVLGGSAGNGTRVIGAECHEGWKNQEWLINDLNDGFFEIKARHSAKCLDIAHGGNGSTAHQWDCHRGGNQRWLITPER